VRDSLDKPRAAGPSAQDTGSALAEWFCARQQLAVPWLRASTRWQVISGEVFLERLVGQHLQWIWPLVERWETPGDTVSAADELHEIARWVDRASRAERLLQIAGRLAETPEALDSDRTIHSVLESSEAVADLSVLTVPSTTDDDDSEEPVLVGRGVLRVAARFTGEETLERRNRMSDGRLAVARMIGYADNVRDAHLGLIELAAAVCRPEGRACGTCPLTSACASSLA